MPIDKQCAHEASLGMQMAMIKTGKHIIEVFAHEDEGENELDYARLAEDRVRKHAINAVWLVRFPEELRKRAGQGLRQGRQHVGMIQKR
jgi:riboflavin synthase